MPEFWQFPTGSMGLGAINAIYQARFLRYLDHRGLLKSAGRKVWAFVGDGEMDEPESLAALSLAAREGLDNLIFVVNCNLQRLDGPVRGNGSIIQELEGLFAGAGWNVIKLMWGSDWDPLFARDTAGMIVKRLHETVDGELQMYAATDGRFNREHFFNKYPELQAIVAHLSDEDIDRLRRGGHDPVKIYAAYHAAVGHRGQPTVILAQTKKGYGMGNWGQGKMGTHQQKKPDDEALKEFRDRFALPLADDDVTSLRFFTPGEDSPELRYLHARRAQLGGYIPARSSRAPKLPVPPLTAFARSLDGSQGRDQSTTVVFVQILTQLLRDPGIGKHIVPIVADEARTFGMQTLFRQVGIYSSVGQLYAPEDREELFYYKEAKDGQILEEGITEAGAMSSWIAAATSYSSNGVPMLPFYIFYSMFGFQRVGDLAWAAADSRSRGFLARRDRRPHDPIRRRPAASGWHKPPHGFDHPELPRVRPMLWLRAGGDLAGRDAAHARGAGGHVLLRDRDERELPAAGAARECARRHSARHVFVARARWRGGAVTRIRDDLARGHRRGGAA